MKRKSFFYIHNMNVFINILIKSLLFAFFSFIDKDYQKDYHNHVTNVKSFFIEKDYHKVIKVT